MWLQLPQAGTRLCKGQAYRKTGYWFRQKWSSPLSRNRPHFHPINIIPATIRTARSSTGILPAWPAATSVLLRIRRIAKGFISRNTRLSIFGLWWNVCHVFPPPFLPLLFLDILLSLLQLFISSQNHLKLALSSSCSEKRAGTFAAGYNCFPCPLYWRSLLQPNIPSESIWICINPNHALALILSPTVDFFCISRIQASILSLMYAYEFFQIIPVNRFSHLTSPCIASSSYSSPVFYLFSIILMTAEICGYPPSCSPPLVARRHFLISLFLA